MIFLRADGLQYFLGHVWIFHKNQQTSICLTPFVLYKRFKQYKKLWEHLQTIILLHISKFRKPICRQFRKRRAPGTDEDPRKFVFKIMDMGPLSIEIMKSKCGKLLKSKKP